MVAGSRSEDIAARTAEGRFATTAIVVSNARSPHIDSFQRVFATMRKQRSLPTTPE